MARDVIKVCWSWKPDLALASSRSVSSTNCPWKPDLNLVTSWSVSATNGYTSGYTDFCTVTSLIWPMLQKNILFPGCFIMGEGLRPWGTYRSPTGICSSSYNVTIYLCKHVLPNHGNHIKNHKIDNSVNLSHNISHSIRIQNASTIIDRLQTSDVCFDQSVVVIQTHPFDFGRVLVQKEILVVWSFIILTL